MSKSLLLDQIVWDLVLGADGNIAACTEPYSLAQDVSTALRTFLGEVYYDTSLGVPYFDPVLNNNAISIGLIQQILVEQALTVTGVVSATCNIITVSDRNLVGQVTITDQNGVTTNVSF